MKQPLLSRLATRRSFAKTTLTGVGVFLGAGIWTEASTYRTSDFGGCLGAISCVCGLQPNAAMKAGCNHTILNLLQAGAGGGVGPGGHQFQMFSSTTLSTAPANCDDGVGAWGTVYGVSEEHIADIKALCCIQ